MRHTKYSSTDMLLQSYGALFPFAQYTLLNSLLTSVACYVALGMVLITFIFPETVNHATLVSTSALIAKLQSIVDVQQQILSASPDDLADGAPLPQKMQGLRVGVFMSIQQSTFLYYFAVISVLNTFLVMGSIKFIGAEFSWGKWNADDVKGLQEPLVVVVNRAGKLPIYPHYILSITLLICLLSCIPHLRQTCRPSPCTHP